MAAHRVRARPPRGDATDLRLTGDADSINAHLEDAAHVRGGHADAVAWPRSEAAVAALVRNASHVLAIGAQSSVTGGATPSAGLILSSAKLTGIQLYGDYAKVGAGVPLAALQAELSTRSRWYPPVPTFTGAFAGGVVATNAAGAATFKYGSTRDWVEGVTIVLASGDVLELARGECFVDGDGRVEIVGVDGSVTSITTPSYRMPDVPKRSAGYFAAPGMDLIDLLIGSEGTLGVIVDVTFRVERTPPAVAFALVPVASEAAAIKLVNELRDASHATWRARDPHGVDVAAIEHMDSRSLAVVREDGVDRQLGVSWPASTSVALLVQLELPPRTDATRVFEEVGLARESGAPDTPVVRFCRMLDRHGVLEATELAPPGDRRRAEALLALREAVPTGVNERVGVAKRTIDAAIEKTPGDMIVPFDSLPEMLALIREAFERRRLDYAVWGHISDGNMHPNVIPRSLDDVKAGREAILEIGREVTRLGGCPLAEHGVGRSAVKQAQLRDLYGDEGIEQMRAVKRALDPEWKLAPGVIFPTV
ncbi:MAG TPA: FAD-binding oxidoreductase [Vicinamibacterales bacterium]|nr:FAD-binding oxidoreductase [Vicinamibacterales bacterium]